MEDELCFGDGLDVGLDCPGLVSWGGRGAEGGEGEGERVTCAPGTYSSKHGGSGRGIGGGLLDAGGVGFISLVGLGLSCTGHVSVRVTACACN